MISEAEVRIGYKCDKCGASKEYLAICGAVGADWDLYDWAWEIACEEGWREIDDPGIGHIACPECAKRMMKEAE